MSAMYTQVDSTGNHIKVLDAQSTLVEWAFPAISATVRSHPCKSMQPLYGVAGSCICYNAKDGNARRQSTTRSLKKGSRQELLCGADSTRSPATKATVPGRRDSAHTPPSGSHWPRISRAHQGIKAVAAAASSLTSTDTPPTLHLVRHAGSPEACERHRKLRLRPLWAGAAACRGVQCAGTGTEETNRRRAISHQLKCVSHTLRKCNVVPDGEDADRWLWNHEEQLLERTNG